MSMTAEERATMLLKAVTADECGDADCPEHAGLHALFKLTLRAHRNAAVEAAAKVADDLCTEEDFHGHSEICLICADIAAAIRALREEE